MLTAAAAHGNEPVVTKSRVTISALARCTRHCCRHVHHRPPPGLRNAPNPQDVAALADRSVRRCRLPRAGPPSTSHLGSLSSSACDTPSHSALCLVDLILSEQAYSGIFRAQVFRLKLLRTLCCFIPVSKRQANCLASHQPESEFSNVNQRLRSFGHRIIPVRSPVSPARLHPKFAPPVAAAPRIAAKDAPTAIARAAAARTAKTAAIARAIRNPHFAVNIRRSAGRPPSEAAGHFFCVFASPDCAIARGRFATHPI